MSVKDGRNVKTRGWTRKHRRAYTKNAKYKDRPDNYFHKSQFELSSSQNGPGMVGSIQQGTSNQDTERLNHGR